MKKIERKLNILDRIDRNIIRLVETILEKKEVDLSQDDLGLLAVEIKKLRKDIVDVA